MLVGTCGIQGTKTLELEFIGGLELPGMGYGNKLWSSTRVIVLLIVELSLQLSVYLFQHILMRQMLSYNPRLAPTYSGLPASGSQVLSLLCASKLSWSWHTRDHFRDFGEDEVNRERVSI